MKIRSLLAVGLISVMLISCATMFNSRTKPVAFRSKTKSVEILINGESKGTTPLTLQLEPSKSYMVTYKKRGYEPLTVALQTHVQAGWVVLDIFAGLIGIAVDAATGKWRAFNEQDHYVTLTKKGR
jgi:hypothetical protein